MAEGLTDQEVQRVAALAHLALTDEEARLYAEQLARILDYARQISALDTTDVPPTAYVDDESGRERPDETRPSLTREEALANAPQALAGLFVVPRVIGPEE